MLLVKGHNDPSLISTLRMGVLSLMQYQGDRGAYARQMVFFCFHAELNST